jgi:hypothetical protein
MSTTAELKASIAARASALRLRLNDPSVDPVAAALEAKRLFEDSMDEIRTRWMTLELGGYRDLVAVQPLHQVLRVQPGSRLATHIAAYRTQRGVQVVGAERRSFAHFFVEALSELVAARDRIRSSGGTSEIELGFGPHAAVPDYPETGEFARDVLERVVGGFVAALYLQLGELSA